MSVLPPGTILQLMYFKERLKSIGLEPGYFLEVGPGSGEITRLLLDLGWHGKSFDLDDLTIERLQIRFQKEVKEGRYSAICSDYFNTSLKESADLVVSCMVLEHLDDAYQSMFMAKSSEYLRHGGVMICLVPASPRHWGIEDKIAGHYRRYTQSKVRELCVNTGYSLQHISGLTFPISNLLLPISNFLVRRSERNKLNLSLSDRTKASGRRQVKFKTHFPSILKLVLNEYFLWPFNVLQKIFRNSKNALVIYFECYPVVENTKHGL